MTDRELLLSTVADLRSAADILERANDTELLVDVEALVKSATSNLKTLRG